MVLQHHPAIMAAVVQSAGRMYWSVQTASDWRAYLLRLSPFIFCLR